MIWSKDRWNCFAAMRRGEAAASVLALGVTSASVATMAQQPNSSAAPKGGAAPSTNGAPAGVPQGAAQTHGSSSA